MALQWTTLLTYYSHISTEPTHTVSHRLDTFKCKIIKVVKLIIYHLVKCSVVSNLFSGSVWGSLTDICLNSLMHRNQECINRYTLWDGTSSLPPPHRQKIHTIFFLAYYTFLNIKLQTDLYRLQTEPKYKARGRKGWNAWLGLPK